MSLASPPTRPPTQGPHHRSFDGSDEQVAFAVLGEDPTYHLVLWSRNQGLHIHHPESGRLESLGKSQWRGGSGELEKFNVQNPWWEMPWPAGWMVVVGPSYGYFARRPDPPGGPWTKLPGNSQFGRWAPDGDFLAAGSGFGSGAKLEVFTYPDLSPVFQHSLPWVDRMIWSPDGRRLAVSTNSGDSGATYLFEVVGR